jgi:hypothetical protein
MFMISVISQQQQTLNNINMRLKSIILCILAVTSLTATSCKKKKSGTPPGPASEAFPILTAISGTGFTNTVTGSGGLEHGCRFSVAKAGKITGLACKVPPKGSFRVTLWSFAAQTIITQVTITTDDVQSPTILGNLSIDVLPNIDYLVTVYTQSQWNEYRRAGGGNIPFPVTSGNITVKSYHFISAASANPTTFPTNTANDRVTGLADILYVPNN